MVPARKSVRESAAVKQSTQAPIAAEIAQLKFLPPVPGLGDVQAQTLEIAVANAILGKQQPAAALKDAAGKATKLMQANQKKFGA
jgi:multiple sugar transport system substrate-binding protein